MSLTGHYAADGKDRQQLVHLTRSFNGYAAEFREASESLDEALDDDTDAETQGH